MGFERFIGFLASSTSLEVEATKVNYVSFPFCSRRDSVCDEKLFRFTGMGGIVRRPSKPGIWHYLAVEFLPLRRVVWSTPAPTTPPVIWVGLADTFTLGLGVTERGVTHPFTLFTWVGGVNDLTGVNRSTRL